MSFIEAVILGLVQGLTEFIPVSSSGHLVFLHSAFGITENGLLFDVALHIGTLTALVMYFHKEILLLIKGILGKNEYTKLAWLIALATIPAVISGMLLQSRAESAFRSVQLVAVNLIVVAVIMLLAEWFARRYKRKGELEKTSTTQALVIGIAQAVAVIPGVSRSGSTITTGLFLGLDRVAATRFSFLLGIPITFGAVIKVLATNEATQMIGNDFGLFAVGIVTALASGLFAIRFLLKYLAGHTLAVFAYYRIVLGLLVLAGGWI
ncbi:MAG TPA: undecaprenyl-diphosphatase UppP [Candidatus Limnocylindria bacterium]|nr:undecaprenyl-diphosphatase UppP [Candidatus Limnocylindria bacterium]